jgi:RND family efflux transporter MFP subunit
VDTIGSSIATAAPVSVSADERPKIAKKQPRHRSYWLAAIVLIGIVGVGAIVSTERGEKSKAEAAGGSSEANHQKASTQSSLIVEATHPRKGGLARMTEQSGSVHAFEHADLYAKVSGYLKVQKVDIGDIVKRDQLLAEIDDPEVHKAVDQMKAMLDTAKAKVKIAEARIKAAEADVKVSQAMIAQAQAGVVTQEANVSLHGKQLTRIQGLVSREAIEGKLADEELDKYEAAKSAERFAHASVLSAQAQEIAKRADLEQARADVEEAQANVEVAQANLAKAEVLAAYTKITSPYDGVVTKRTYHRGDFVRSAESGGALPILAVARTDKMRVVLPVPDRDVTFVDRGDPAVVRLDALHGEEFPGTVARFASTEDPESRNMRTEVDLENPTGRLKEGMYGRVTILLKPAAVESVSIPSSALLSQNQKGEGFVFVVREGKARKIAVHVGSDTGVETEIISGLIPEDLVVTRYNGAIGEGTPVTIEMKKDAKPEH